MKRGSNEITESIGYLKKVGGWIAGLGILLLAITVVMIVSSHFSEQGVKAVASEMRPVWLVQRFELNEVGAWVMTVASLDTVTGLPASYKIWADRPYLGAAYPPRSGGKRVTYKMPAEPKYYHGAPGPVDHWEVAAIDTPTIFWAQRLR